MKSRTAALFTCLALCSSALAQGLHIEIVQLKEYRVRGKVVVEAEDFLMEMPKELYDALPSKDKTYRVKTKRYLLYVTLPHFYTGPDPESLQRRGEAVAVFYMVLIQTATAPSPTRIPLDSPPPIHQNVLLNLAVFKKMPTRTQMKEEREP